MRPKYYKLNGHDVVPCADSTEWADWYEKAARSVALTHLTPEIRISTVFLGLDHNFDLNGDPDIFETLVFGGELDGHCWRCSTWEQAVAIHDLTVEKLRKAFA